MAQVAEYVLSLPLDTVIVSGGARGVDEYAAWVAEERGMQTEIIRADWETHGKAAGPIRNRILVRANLDRLTAFWDGASPGTRNVINEARKVIGFERVEVRKA